MQDMTKNKERFHNFVDHLCLTDNDNYELNSSLNCNAFCYNRSCTSSCLVSSICSKSSRLRSQFDQVIMRFALTNAITYSCRLNHVELMRIRVRMRYAALSSGDSSSLNRP